jgi:hypothetical protein
MLPYGWKDACLFSPSRGPLRLDFYPLGLLPARVKGSGQECPLYTSQSLGLGTRGSRDAVECVPQRLKLKLVAMPSGTAAVPFPFAVDRIRIAAVNRCATRTPWGECLDTSLGVSDV